jgi:hypothetical protein
MSDLIERLLSLADCDSRAGEPLGACMREAAAYITKLEIEVKLAGAGVTPEPDLSERMGDRDTLSWLLASFFSGDRQPHMSGDPRARLSPLRRRDLDDAVQGILASGFARVGTEMDYIRSNRQRAADGNEA